MILCERQIPIYILVENDKIDFTYRAIRLIMSKYNNRGEYI
jgi:hypothetical protein